MSLLFWRLHSNLIISHENIKYFFISFPMFVCWVQHYLCLRYMLPCYDNSITRYVCISLNSLHRFFISLNREHPNNVYSDLPFSSYYCFKFLKVSGLKSNNSRSENIMWIKLFIKMVLVIVNFFQGRAVLKKTCYLWRWRNVLVLETRYTTQQN